MGCAFQLHGRISPVLCLLDTCCGGSHLLSMLFLGVDRQWDHHVPANARFLAAFDIPLYLQLSVDASLLRN